MIYFIVNPVAGNGNGLKAAAKISKLMEAKNVNYKILESESPGHAEALSAKCIAKGAKSVVAVGGDGTVLECARGFYNKETGKFSKSVSFGIIPVGSGNDFVRSLKIPKDIEKAVDIILSNKTMPCDMIMVNGVLALNIICMGIDSEIVRLSYLFKKFSPKLSYVFSAAIKIFTYKSLPAKVYIGDKLIEGDFTIIAMANGRYYGGGFQIAPDASLNDGMFTVVYAHHMPWYKLLVFFPMVPSGKHVNLKEAIVMKCDKIRVCYDKSYAFNIDGNIIDTDGTIEAEMINNAINVIHNL